MKELAIAWGIGALSGSRSMLGPAVVAQSALSPPARTVLSLLAAGELIADKNPGIPARTDAPLLAGRLVMGAAAAAGYAKRKRFQAALIGAAGALVSTYASFHLRRFVTNRFRIPNAVAGMMEDAAALGAGAMLMHARR
jgi:uncharacterized membrane protein